MNTKSTLRVYGCGGTGLNITRLLEITGQTAGFPVTAISQIDTSTSNIKETQANCTVNIIPGLSGTGKNRKFSVEVVKPAVTKMLITNPPADFNIVVFSAAGGSGSVIGPLLMELLLARGHTAVALIVGSTSSAIETSNTIGTYTDLNKISKRLELPVVCGFFQNYANNRADIDAKIERRIRALAMMASGENEEIDNTDIANWVNYPRTISVAPTLVDMIVLLNDNAEDDIPETALSMVTVYGAGESIGKESCSPLYHAEGRFNQATITATSHSIDTMDFIITNTLLAERMTELHSVRSSFAEHLQDSNGVLLAKFDDDDGVM